MKQSVKSAKLQHFPLCCSKAAKTKNKHPNNPEEEEEVEEETATLTQKLSKLRASHCHTLCMGHHAADLANLQNHKQLYSVPLPRTIIVKTSLIGTYGRLN